MFCLGGLDWCGRANTQEIFSKSNTVCKPGVSSRVAALTTSRLIRYMQCAQHKQQQNMITRMMSHSGIIKMSMWHTPLRISLLFKGLLPNRHNANRYSSCMPTIGYERWVTISIVNRNYMHNA